MKSFRPRTFSRRQLLAGGAAAGALAPFLPRLEARGQTKKVKRLVLFFWSGGTTANQYLPTGSETNFTFSPLMQSLEPWKQKLIVFGNLRRSQDNARGSHQAGTAGIWTAGRMLSSGGTGMWVSHPSIDQLIAKQVPQGTTFPTLEFDVQSQDPGNLRGVTVFGMDGRPLHGEQDPSRGFDRIFAGGIVAPPSGGGSDPLAGEKLRARRKSVLDLVRTELSALSNQLGGQDKKKLEQHLEALRSTESRLTAPVGGGGVGTAGGGFTPPTKDAFPKLEFKANDNFPMVGKLHMDLLVSSLAADQTRIANIQFSQGNGDIVYRWLGVTAQHHALTHRAENAPGLSNIHKWYYEQFAYFLSRMDAVKEPDGTSLLDNSVVVFGNEFVSGFSHDTDPWPVMLAGSGGGHFKTGRFMNFPTAGGGPRLFPGDTAVAATPSQTQLLTSICHYMGAMVPRVGDPTMGPAGPLPNLT